MLSSIFLILGVAALSLGLRTFHNTWCQKLGALGILVASFLAGYLLSGYVIAGVVCALSWFLLPWVEILTRIRKLRLPHEKLLRHKSPPSLDLFPELTELTEEVEEEGFAHTEDAGWDWDDYQQFFRLFYNQSDRSQAAICLIEQDDIAFYYLSISSRGMDGTIWTTWNYPFSYSLKLVPHHHINRLRNDQMFLQLLESHRCFLADHGVSVEELEEQNPDEIQLEIQKDLRAQIDHNLAKGVLTEAGEGQIRYSWRGLFFIWFQFLRDLVRLS